MKNLEQCFKLPMSNVNVINKVLNYVNKNTMNKQNVYRYIVDERMDLDHCMSEFVDSEIQIKFVILLRRVLPNNEFLSIFENHGTEVSGLVCKNIRWYCCELLTRYNRTTKIFGYRLDGYNIIACTNQRTNTPTNTSYVFFNRSDIKLYDNKKIISLAYKTVLKYSLDTTKLVLYREKIRIELFISEICSEAVGKRFLELGIAKTGGHSDKACSNMEMINAMKVSVPIKNICMKSDENISGDSTSCSFVQKKIQMEDGLEFTITSKMKRSMRFDFRKAFDDSASNDCTENNEQTNMWSKDQRVRDVDDLDEKNAETGTRLISKHVMKDHGKVSKEVVNFGRSCTLNIIGHAVEKEKLRDKCLASKQKNTVKTPKETSTRKIYEKVSNPFLNFSSSVGGSSNDVIHNGRDQTFKYEKMNKKLSNGSSIEHSTVNEHKRKSLSSDIDKIFDSNTEKEHVRPFRKTEQTEVNQHSYFCSSNAGNIEVIPNTSHVKSKKSSFKSVGRRRSKKKRKALVENISCIKKHVQYHKSNLCTTTTSNVNTTNYCKGLIGDIAAPKEGKKYKSIIEEHMINYKKLISCTMNVVERDLKVLSKEIKHLVNYRIKYR